MAVYRYFRLPRAATVFFGRSDVPARLTPSCGFFPRHRRTGAPARCPTHHGSNIREMCDPCAEVARDTCFNLKGAFLRLLWCVKWAIRGIPSDFDCGSWLTEHRYETSFPVADDPGEGETVLRKGLITDPFVRLNHHYFIYLRLVTKTFLLDYTVPFCPLLKASKVNVL